MVSPEGPEIEIEIIIALADLGTEPGPAFLI